MTQPVLTDAEMHALISGNPFTLGLSIARLKDFIRQIEKAVLAKQKAEHRPFTPRNAVEMREFIGKNFDSLQYANPETEEPNDEDRYTLSVHDLLSAFSWCGHYDIDDRMPIINRSVSPVSHKTACVSENAVCETQDILNMAEKHGLFYNDAGEYKPWIKEDGGFNGEIISFARELIKENNRTAKNHIEDVREMVTPLAKRKIQDSIDREGYRKIEGVTVLVNEHGRAAIVNHGGAYYWVDNYALAREYDGRSIPAIDPKARQHCGKMIEQERKSFESWSSLQHGLCVMHGPSVYYSHLVGWMWKAWLAAKGIKGQTND